MSYEYANTVTNVTHLLWAGRWIEVTAVACHDNESGWRFKNGRDAAAWLMWSPREENPE